jgi:hypothetical protein
MAMHLRVYPNHPEDDAVLGPVPAVRVQLGELLPLLALAQKRNYVWLQDFLEDEVRITEDLYEVLQAFRCHRPSA